MFFVVTVYCKLMASCFTGNFQNNPAYYDYDLLNRNEVKPLSGWTFLQYGGCGAKFQVEKNDKNKGKQIKVYAKCNKTKEGRVVRIPDTRIDCYF